LEYVNAQQHAKRHKAWSRVNQPKPEPALVGLGPFVPVHGKLNKRLHAVAFELKRENHYDFTPWDERGIAGSDGYLIVDAKGRVVGGFAVSPWDYSGAPRAAWLMVWIFVAKAHRRQGWLRRSWQWAAEQYGNDILPDPPFSDTARAFFMTIPKVKALLPRSLGLDAPPPPRRLTNYPVTGRQT
jgi:hypothetical protein